MSARFRWREYWVWAALFASAAMLAAAHAFERFGGLAPCPLCLQQRDVYWGAMVLAIVALFVLRYRPDPVRRRIANLLLGLVFLVGTGVALYHVAVEQHWVVAQCDAANADDIAVMGSGGFDVPRCDTPAWTMFGVSMAGYNALISLGLSALSFVAARGVKA